MMARTSRQLAQSMARNSRLSVGLPIEIRNSSNTHCIRLISRQRTTPCTAGIGPARHKRHQRVALLVVQKRRVARRLPINKVAWPTGVDGQHPIPNPLETNATHPSGLGSRTIKAAAASGN
jgi:hypothetical protein